MKQVLKQIHKYLRRKLKELRPEFISIHVWVPPDVHRDLVDELGGGDRLVEGRWPEETTLTFTPTPPEEE